MDANEPITQHTDPHASLSTPADPRVDQSLGDAIRHLRADSGTIHLKTPGRMLLVLAGAVGVPQPVLDIVRVVPWGKGMAGLAAERAEPVDACNIQTDTSGDVKPGARQTGMQGAIVVPMLRAGAVVGTFGVGCRAERTFTPHETAWLQAHANTLAEAMGLEA
jgi:L-methionine (R)-S-oxide reductase